MIVKLQRSLSDPTDPVFACDQARMMKQFIPITPALETLFGDRFKIFVEAEVTPDGKFASFKRVADRAW